jgi:hypothetical protein
MRVKSLRIAMRRGLPCRADSVAKGLPKAGRAA